VKYMLILLGEETGFEEATPEEAKAEMDGWAAFDQAVAEAGVFVSGEGLQESATATTLRIRAGDAEPMVTDGPFAETKEQLGGFYVLDCADLDEALRWAKRIPMRSGAIEVRPVMDYEAMGYTHLSD
jgi:hypothetical protein